MMLLCCPRYSCAVCLTYEKLQEHLVNKIVIDKLDLKIEKEKINKTKQFIVNVIVLI